MLVSVQLVWYSMCMSFEHSCEGETSDTSWKAISERAGGRELTQAELRAFFEEHGAYMRPSDNDAR